MVLPFGLESDGQHNSNAGRSLITPTAPPAESLDGAGPYIDFIVVNGDERYTVRTEKKAVLESSVELAKIVNAGRKNDTHFPVSNVDKTDFETLIRFLETKFIKFRDHLHIVKILELADRYNCPDLVIKCIRELDLQLNSDTVLDVFRSLWYYNSITPASNAIKNEDTGKNKKGKAEQTNQNPFTPEEHYAALLSNTLQLIDMDAEQVLAKDQMNELRFEELEMIAKRDTLQLASDTTLYECLADWSIEECKRKKLDLTAENRRRVLGALVYCPRYLTITTKDFKRICERVELLDSAEIQLVLDSLAGKKLSNLTPEQTSLLEKFRTPRPAFAKMPIHLSDRSNPKNYPKKMRRANKKEADGSEGCWANCGMNCLSVFICIFD